MTAAKIPASAPMPTDQTVPALLAKAEALLDGTSPGEWVLQPFDERKVVRVGNALILMPIGGDHALCDRNQAFCVAAHNDLVADLVSVVRAYRAALEHTVEILKRRREPGPFGSDYLERDTKRLLASSVAALRQKGEK